MVIRTFGELIDWTRSLHTHMSRCLSHSATENEEERARALMDYLAAHEAEIERLVQEFEKQSTENTLKTRIYDHLSHHPVVTHRTCEGPYAKLDFDAICREVFDFHDQIIALYKFLLGRAEIPEARDLFQSLLTMEKNESMRLARQIGRMNDL